MTSRHLAMKVATVTNVAYKALFLGAMLILGCASSNGKFDHPRRGGQQDVQPVKYVSFAEFAPGAKVWQPFAAPHVTLSADERGLLRSIQEAAPEMRWGVHSYVEWPEPGDVLLIAESHAWYDTFVGVAYNTDSDGVVAFSLPR